MQMLYNPELDGLSHVVRTTVNPRYLNLNAVPVEPDDWRFEGTNSEREARQNVRRARQRARSAKYYRAKRGRRTQGQVDKIFESFLLA